MRQSSLRYAAALVLVGALFSANAQAQDGTGTPNQPPPNAPPTSAPQPLPPSGPGAGQTAPASGATPAQGAAAPTGAGATTAPIDAEENEDNGRLRIGFNFLNAGVGSAGDLSGPTIGVTFRIGWQLNRLMGVYGNISPFVWFGSTDQRVAGQSLDISAISGTQFTPLFSLTPHKIIELAAGPSLDYLSGGSVSVGPNNASAGGFSGIYFGVHGKAALHLGGKPNALTGRRTGFTIEANVHPSFTPGDAALFITGGLGYDWY